MISLWQKKVDFTNGKSLNFRLLYTIPSKLAFEMISMYCYLCFDYNYLPLEYQQKFWFRKVDFELENKITVRAGWHIIRRSDKSKQKMSR